jgi:C-terminal processing protease CtpA/Prc
MSFILLHPHLLYSIIFSGLGFNIVGGTDQQYVSNDSGIYVSRIKENGAAALDGRLQEGDKILSVRTGFGPLFCTLIPKPMFKNHKTER